MNNNNVQRSRSRNRVQSVPDDIYGTMRNTTNYSGSVASNSYQSAEDIRMAREARESAGTTPPESYLNQTSMDADPKQASARALKNGTKNSR